MTQQYYIKFKYSEIHRVMSNQLQIKFMLATLKTMNQKLGAQKARKALADSQFDFIQDEFLAQRHRVQKYQDIKQREGLTKDTADIPQKIRDGVQNLEDLLERLKKEYHRLQRKKKDAPQVLAKKKKIVSNCQLLFKDIQDRYYGQNNPNSFSKPLTLTDMKSKLLKQIDSANYDIHQRANSQDKLSSIDDDEAQAIQQYNRIDKQQDIIVDNIIVGVQGVRKKVQGINSKQDQINEKIDTNNKQAGQLEKRLKTDNEKLKVVIQKMKPNRCCIAIFLLLVLIGLVVVIIKFLIPQDGSQSTQTTTQ